MGVGGGLCAPAAGAHLEAARRERGRVAPGPSCAGHGLAWAGLYELPQSPTEATVSGQGAERGRCGEYVD